MHKAKIVTEGRSTKIFLDDKEIEGITYYSLSHGVGGKPELTFTIWLEQANVIPEEK